MVEDFCTKLDLRIFRMPKRLWKLTEFHLIEIVDFKDLATLQPLTRRIQARKSTPTVASLPESKFSLVRDLVVDRSGVY